MDFGLVKRLRGESTVGARHHVVAANQADETHQPLGNPFRMLNDIACVGYDPRAKHFAVGQPNALEQVIFMLVARVGRFEAE